MLVIHNVIMQTAQVKQAIKKSTQQMAQEPLELLKNAARQVTGSEIENGPVSSEQTQNTRDEVNEQNYKKQVAEQDGRHLQALESELKDIRRQKLFNELMKRIQNGEDIPLEEFTELSYEQKDVLKAHAESVRNNQIANSKLQTVDMPTSKKGRKMGGGQKGAAKKEQTRVEKPIPPSG